jgi:potassium-transporting ATPase KdpC subunit
MHQHIRAIVLYIVVSLILCCVLYPLVTLGIARVIFPNQAAGSLIDEKGRPVTEDQQAVGSRLIAQPFTSDEYFQPRPSATTPAYNAAASGASNYGANNIQLRDRVARQIGPLVKYASGPKKGQPVGPDVEAWLQKDQGGDKGIVATWAKNYPTLATNWVKSDPLLQDPDKGFVAAWLKVLTGGDFTDPLKGVDKTKITAGLTSHPEEAARWKSTLQDAGDYKPEDQAGLFFESFGTIFPGTWPSLQDQPTADGKTEKVVKAVKDGSDVQSYLFDMWLQENGDADLEKIPADMVMASGSGLDPDITLKNALYQLDRVAGKWAEKTKGNKDQIADEIKGLLNQKAHAPLGGLVGVPLVNVLEVNLALKERYGAQVVADAR